MARAIQRMEAGACYRWCVADVMQPGGALKKVGVRKRGRGEGASCPCYAARVTPTTRECAAEQALRDHGGIGRCHLSKVGAQLTAEASRVGTSWDVLC